MTTRGNYRTDPKENCTGILHSAYGYCSTAVPSTTYRNSSSQVFVDRLVSIFPVQIFSHTKRRMGELYSSQLLVLGKVRTGPAFRRVKRVSALWREHVPPSSTFNMVISSPFSSLPLHYVCKQECTDDIIGILVYHPIAGRRAHNPITVRNAVADPSSSPGEVGMLDTGFQESTASLQALVDDTEDGISVCAPGFAIFLPSSSMESFAHRPSDFHHQLLCTEMTMDHLVIPLHSFMLVLLIRLISPSRVAWSAIFGRYKRILPR